MIFRLSQRLNAKVKAGVLRALPLHENPLADWSAHLFVAGRAQYLLLSNTASLYSTVMYGKGVTARRRPPAPGTPPVACRKTSRCSQAPTWGFR